MSSHGKLPFSVAIITLNEADWLAECLASVSSAAEVVVVDSGSTDQTLEIATQFGARVLQESWRGFGPQKQFAIDQCRERWVFILDADERLPRETITEIEKILADPAPSVAYSFPRKNYFMGRWIRHGGWWPDRVTRLFQKDGGNCRMSANLVHESLIIEGPVGRAEHPIVHLTGRGLGQTIQKINRYSSVGAEELFQQGGRASIGKAFSRGGWAFFYNYFFRRGFLDGAPGLVIAVCDAVNKFFKYAKLYELRLSIPRFQGGAESKTNRD